VEAGGDVTAAFEGGSDVRTPGGLETATDGGDPDDEFVTGRRVGHGLDDRGVLDGRDVVAGPLAGVVAIEDGDHVAVAKAEDSHGRLRALGELFVGEDGDGHWLAVRARQR